MFKESVIDSRLVENTRFNNVTHHYPHDVADGSKANWGAIHSSWLAVHAKNSCKYKYLFSTSIFQYYYSMLATRDDINI